MAEAALEAQKQADAAAATPGQTATDAAPAPADVLAQLGSRVQHQLRAFTPDDAKALRATVPAYPKSGYDLEETLTVPGTGEAIVTVMNEKGAPSPVAWARLCALQARCRRARMPRSTPPWRRSVLEQVLGSKATRDVLTTVVEGIFGTRRRR